MKICISIGYPLKHSCSPLIHNAAYKALGIENQFAYTTFEVRPQDLKKAVDGVRTLGIRGMSITMPFKQVVMRYLDTIDDDAKIIGAVNTIVNDDGKLTGYNTDWIGAITALEQKTKLKGKKVAVIGAGGASRAIVYGLIKKRAFVKIFNRSKDKVNKLAKEFNCEVGGLDALKEITKVDIIINATSVGMIEDKSVIDKRFLNKKQIVFDAVYLPKQTKLIKEASSTGAKVIFGYEMLLYQGVKQFKLYTGFNAPIEVMREALIKNL